MMKKTRSLPFAAFFLIAIIIIGLYDVAVVAEDGQGAAGSSDNKEVKPLVGNSTIDSNDNDGSCDHSTPGHEHHHGHGGDHHHHIHLPDDSNLQKEQVRH
jgi:hypothetical protein